MRYSVRSTLARQSKCPFHHLHATPADMGGSHRAGLFSDAGQQQARPPHVDALSDPQFLLAVARDTEIGE